MNSRFVYLVAMDDFQQVLVPCTSTVREAMAVINDFASGLHIAFVVDERSRLLGALSDGDIRRALLRGTQLEENVQSVMNDKPISVSVGTPTQDVIALINQKEVTAIPEIDEAGVVQRIHRLDAFRKHGVRDNLVVIMAGGVGSRLRPFTEETPKPMLSVGGKPILETILSGFADQGFRNIVLAVNYQSAAIKEHIGDGSSFGVSISYLEESKPLGTAGPLTLLGEKPKQPIIVSNGDLLTKVNYQSLVDWHMEHKSVATMCVRHYDFQIPFGVVQSKKHHIVELFEKPLQSYWVNAGIYVLEPEALEFLPNDSYFDMTSLFQSLIEQDKTVCSFPVGEYWLDVGRHSDFERAQQEYARIFDES